MARENPIYFTEEAKEYFLNLLSSNSFPEPFLRIGMNGGACGGSFVLGFDTKTDFDDEFEVALHLVSLKFLYRCSAKKTSDPYLLMIA